MMHTIYLQCVLTLLLLLALTDQFLRQPKIYEGILREESERFNENKTFLPIYSESENNTEINAKESIIMSANGETNVSNYAEREDAPKLEGKIVDFVIAGFPKCSTTFLRNDLLNTKHIFYGTNDTEIFLSKYKHVEDFVQLYENVTDSRIKKGFKNPNVLYSEMTLSFMQYISPRTDFIVSVRHPVSWFQAFYNYRLRKGYHMPHPLNLIGTCATKDEGVLIGSDVNRVQGSHKVCTDRANFHIALSRLGKTPMLEEQEMTLLHNHKLPIHHFPNRVFLMELGQLSVENRTRADQFVGDLETFLHLSQSGGGDLPRLKPHLAKHNVAKSVNITSLNENVLDVCSEPYDSLRNVLMKIGKESALWITKHFLESPDVIVSDKEHFIDLLEKWENDPCLEKLSEK